MPHSFIAIEGNIGAGKTTLCEKLAADFNCRLILEEFAENPFLPYFYQNPERYAFPVELFFMTERHKQLQTELTQGSLFQQTILSDYFFLKTLLFARKNLIDEEFRLFQRLFHVLSNALPKPSLLVYLHRSVEKLQEHIASRGRAFEQTIDTTYLSKIQTAYFEFFKTNPSLPIVLIDAESADFQNDPSHYKAIVDILHLPHDKGLHSFTIPIKTL